MSSLSYVDLCLPFRNDLLALARRYTASEAEDLVQDTLIKAFRSWDRFTPENDVHKDVKAWLRRILTNTFFTQWKRDNRYDVVLLDINDAEHSGNGQKAATNREDYDDLPTPDEYNIVTKHLPNFFASPFDDNEELHDAVEKLAPMYQDVIVKHYLHDLSYEEIAQELSIAVTQVQKRLWRARQYLKKSLRHASFVKSAAFKAPKSPKTKTNRVQRVMGDDDARALLIGDPT